MGGGPKRGCRLWRRLGWARPRPGAEGAAGQPRRARPAAGSAGRGRRGALRLPAEQPRRSWVAPCRLAGELVPRGVVCISTERSFKFTCFGLVLVNKNTEPQGLGEVGLCCSWSEGRERIYLGACGHVQKCP